MDDKQRTDANLKCIYIKMINTSKNHYIFHFSVVKKVLEVILE